MIIKIKPKLFPELGTIRYRRHFFIYKRYKNSIFLFQTMYIKEMLQASWPALYHDALQKYKAGEPYDKSNLSFKRWGQLSQGNLSWKLLDILTKQEAFTESL